MALNLDQSIGNSVTENPELVKVYMAHGVDFCCGGNRTVKEAIESDAKDTNRVIEEANKTLFDASQNSNGSKKLSELSNEMLIDQILKTHHVYLKKELPLLSELIFKLLMVHGQNHETLFEIHALFGHLKTELESHLVKEETLLFPAILSNANHIKPLIQTLEEEHDGAGDALHKLTDLTDHFKLPKGACKTYELVYAKLKHLVADMYMHVHSENNVLFKRFE